MRGLSFCLAGLIGFGSMCRAGEKASFEPGNYIVYYAFGSTSPEQAFALIKVEKKGGKFEASLSDSAPELKSELKGISVDGRKVRVVFDLNSRLLSFEGLVETKNAKSALGSFGDEGLPARGRLAMTGKDKLERDDLRVSTTIPEALTSANRLGVDVIRLQNKLRIAKGEEAQAEAKKQLEAAEKELSEKAPPLYREIIEMHPDSPLIVDAVIGLLRSTKSLAKANDAAKLIRAVEKLGQIYGERFAMNALLQCSAAMAGQKDLAATAIETLDKAAKYASGQTGIETEMRILRAMQSIHEGAGQTEQAKQVDAKLDKLYLAKVPPFKPAPFEARKKKSDRVAVLELFTGAQCPPCVAADVAFDALLKSYKPTELVLVQYHLHIPGPDPLTNADSEARWKYYVRPNAPVGVPYSIFNGKPEGSGGGGLGNSEAKFKEFKGFIDPILNTESTIKLGGSLSRKGDKLDIKIDVDGVKEGDESLKLRIVLVEESIKYVGGNGIRFHHHVVRAMPGGADGVLLKEAKSTNSAEVDLAELRKKLKAYLEDLESGGREFPNPEKPLALKNLRVIAFVQDDGNKEILQAVQLEVPEEK
jgi:hypothetical protein